MWGDDTMRLMPLKEDGYYSLPKRRERIMPHRAPSGSTAFDQETEAVRGKHEPEHGLFPMATAR